MVVERVVHLERHRVPRLGPVDREDRHALVALQQDLARGAGRHRRSSSSRLRSPSLGQPTPDHTASAAPSQAAPLVVQESPVDRSRRNVLLLALCQAAFISTAALMATIGTLAGHALAADKALATLPATALTVGTALGTIPASLVMRRVGRRLGFIVGSRLHDGRGPRRRLAVLAESFWLLAAGGFLMGVSSAFAQLYRFAAAEAVTPERRGRAISLVLAGGLLAGFIGPAAGGLDRGSPGHAVRRVVPVHPAPRAGEHGRSCWGSASRRPPRRGSRARTRPVIAIVRQPLFLVAVASEMAGYGVMNLLMTGTPLAMVAHHGHGLRDAAFVIEWHLVGMFLPGLLHGHAHPAHRRARDDRDRHRGQRGKPRGGASPARRSGTSGWRSCWSAWAGTSCSSEGPPW